MDELLVSIIVPTYNVEQYVGQALDSIFAQTYKNIEVIVVDDGSKDKTAEVVRRYGNRVQFWVFEKNRGAAAVLNDGLTNARGELVLFFDADDILPEYAIERYIHFFKQNPKFTFAYAFYYAFFDHVSSGLYKYNFLYPEIATFKRFVQGNFLKLSQVMIRRDILMDRHIRFDESLRYGGDWDLWLQLTYSGARGVLLPERLLYNCQRITGQSGSSRGKFYAQREAIFLWEKWGRFLSLEEQESVGLATLIERARIKMLVNSFGNPDRHALDSMRYTDFQSILGKCLFFVVSIFRPLIPAALFDRIMTGWYHQKERKKTFSDSVSLGKPKHF